MIFFVKKISKKYLILFFFVTFMRGENKNMKEPSMPYLLEKMHKFFFDWFEVKRKNDGLYYSVRKQADDRLRHGYIS